MKLARPLFIALSCALLAGCGVRFSDPPTGTDFFKRVTLTGDFRAGGTITAHVAITQHYPVDVPVACELRRSSQALRTLATATVAAEPGGGPTATPAASTYTFDFKIDAPGAYNVKCVTPTDIDNFIVKQFTVRG